MTGKRMNGIQAMRCGQYRSTFEATVAMNCPVKLQYEPYSLMYQKEYTPDFLLPNGIIVETKGYFPPEDRTKMRQVKASNPELDIRFLFQPTASKASLKTYMTWCKKNKFKYAIGNSIPLEWINEQG